MHPCLRVDEILRLIACELVASKGKTTAVALACCCKIFEDPALDALWGTQKWLFPLLESFPGDVWDRVGDGSFKRPPTRPEWARFRKYARRMQKLKWSGLSDELPSQVSSVLAFRALSEPLLPNLRYLSLGGNFIPFIPLILSPTISVIKFKFYELEPSETPAAASIIAAFPEVCPNLQHIRLQYLPRDPMITAAASELLLTTNRDTLRSFHVDSPLTEEAHEVISNLPDLRGLSVVVKGDASLPPAIPPNLTNLAVTYDGDWSPMFHGATLKKLESITFDCESDQADDFLETFKNIALATSISATLSQFSFYTTHPWRPNYRSLLLFTQMKELYMHFFCEGGCSSTIDDDTVTDLARAMPMLEVLYLGRTLCKTPRGVTAKGLAALAHHCRRLSRLRIHFQVVNPDPPKTPVVISGGGSTIPREDQCALTVLEVGEIYIPEESMLVVGLTLLRIFPRLETISSGYGGRRWQEIEDALCCSKRFIDHLRATLENVTRS